MVWSDGGRRFAAESIAEAAPLLEPLLLLLLFAQFHRLRLGVDQDRRRRRRRGRCRRRRGRSCVLTSFDLLRTRLYWFWRVRWGFLGLSMLILETYPSFNPFNSVSISFIEIYPIKCTLRVLFTLFL